MWAYIELNITSGFADIAAFVATLTTESSAYF
jgi:hypothetical protein